MVPGMPVRVRLNNVSSFFCQNHHAGDLAREVLWQIRFYGNPEERIINSRDKLNLTPIEEHEFVSNERIKIILEKGIKTIQDVEKIYKEKKEELIKTTIKRFENDYNITGFVEGATVFWIIDEIENYR